MLCERPKVVADGGERRPPKESTVRMPHENFELVLQETCVQHKSVASMKHELEPAERATDASHRLGLAERPTADDRPAPL
uniref:Uncharacterized protein n=1 Tax=Steinernema glaseri TaxID=37863 RepID=A0A1I7XYA5_9BILA